MGFLITYEIARLPNRHLVDFSSSYESEFLLRVDKRIPFQKEREKRIHPGVVHQQIIVGRIDDSVIVFIGSGREFGAGLDEDLPRGNVRIECQMGLIGFAGP